MSTRRRFCGVYMILNTTNNKFYIGSSCNMLNRRKEHFWTLSRGIHCNSYLQRSYNKYGKENFKFYLVEELKFPIDYHTSQRELVNEHLIGREQYWIDRMSPHYNLVKIAGPHGVPNMTQEIRDKISRANTGRRNSMQMKVEMARLKNGSKVIEIYKDSTLVHTCNLSQEVAAYTNSSRSLVSMCLAGKNKTCKGFTLQYKNI